MHMFIAIAISLVVGAICGYSFRGWISREKNYIGSKL